MPRAKKNERSNDTSDLLHKLQTAVEDAQGKRPCKLCSKLDGLDKPTAEAIRSAIAARRPDGKRAIGPVPLTKILQESGFNIGNYTVERHLKEDHQ